ncbi:Tvingi protein, partial [Trypanosoma conorhini]
GAILYNKTGHSIRRVSAAGILACSSYRAECIAMERGLRTLCNMVHGPCPRRLKAAVFTDSLSLSLLMVLKTGPVRATDGILRRIWCKILFLARMNVDLSFQFVFSHCGVARNERVGTAADQGHAMPQRYPAWITDIITGVKRRCRRKELAVHEAGEGPKTHRTALLGHIRPTPKTLSLNRVGEAVMAQFRTGSSARFGYLYRIINSEEELLHCRWCSGAATTTTANHATPPPPPEPPPVPLAWRQMDPVVSPLCNVILAQRMTGTTHMMAVHKWTREAATRLLKKAHKAPFITMASAAIYAMQNSTRASFWWATCRVISPSCQWRRRKTPNGGETRSTQSSVNSDVRVVPKSSF